MPGLFDDLYCLFDLSLRPRHPPPIYTANDPMPIDEYAPHAGSHRVHGFIFARPPDTPPVEHTVVIGGCDGDCAWDAEITTIVALQHHRLGIGFERSTSLKVPSRSHDKCDVESARRETSERWRVVTRRAENDQRQFPRCRTHRVTNGARPIPCSNLRGRRPIQSRDWGSCRQRWRRGWI